MIIDSTYFIREIEIPNLSNSFGISPSIPSNSKSALDLYINKYEPEYLIKLIGQTMYDDYVENSESDRWKSFIGVVANLETKVSPIANYVFYHIWPQICNQRTGAGDTKGKFENTISLSPAQAQLSAWNEMVNMTSQLLEWIEEHVSDFETEDLEFDFCNTYELLSYQNIFGI